MAVAKKKNVKKRTQTEAQKKKVETYKTTQAAYNEKKKKSNEYRQAASFASGNKLGMASAGVRKEKGVGAFYKGVSSAKQERAAMARNEAKRSPIRQTAAEYQKSRTAASAKKNKKK
jgi:hypothetical protein